MVSVMRGKKNRACASGKQIDLIASILMTVEKVTLELTCPSCSSGGNTGKDENPNCSALGMYYHCTNIGMYVQ